MRAAGLATTEVLPIDDLQDLLDQAVDHAPPGAFEAEFDVIVGLNIGDALIVTCQRHSGARVTSWTLEPAAQPEVVVRLSPSELPMLCPGTANLPAGRFGVVCSGAVGSQVHAVLPPQGAVQVLLRTQDPSLKMVDLILDVEVTETPAGALRASLWVCDSAFRTTPRVPRYNPVVRFSLPWSTWEPWRLGRMSLLEALTDGGRVEGHWTELLCAHGLSQLSSVKSALAATGPVAPEVLLWGIALS